MKINSKKQGIIVLFTGLICMIFFMSCLNQTQTSDKEKREVVVYSKCSSNEASSDILYSVNEIKEQLVKKDIFIKMSDKKKSCGYLLVNGPKTKEIKGALTDIELLQEVNKFFK